MKTNLILIVTILSVSCSGYSQPSFIKTNREIFNKMQQDVRKVMNDFQTSIEQMGFMEDFLPVDAEINNSNPRVNESPNSGEATDADYYPDVYPIANEFRLTSGYGYRIDPFTGKEAFHGGIDLAMPENTEVVSCGAGKVVEAGYTRINGNYIIVDHGNKYRSCYGHLSRLLVKKDDEVTKGQVIGLSGNSGRSTGPHLHFQISLNGKTVDPLSIIN